MEVSVGCFGLRCANVCANVCNQTRKCCGGSVLAAVAAAAAAAAWVWLQLVPGHVIITNG